MKTAEIRSRFLQYFERNGHAVVASSSLVPQNDPTLLFTNAGMNQFKDVFTGKEARPYKRAATAQKCVRAGGKHNDLENVGFTARHHTFFEMLGNFSFGDYFKKDAIRFAWEFVTTELKLPKDKLYVTVFETDDEAADLWHEQEGVPRDRIYRFGEKDNFWAMGDTGPCGPCSEIFIDRGEKYSCGKPTCKMGCDCDRFMEFWNLVFMQYERSADGELRALPKPSVDTGAGLERIASILQGVDTNYDIDSFQHIIGRIAKLAGRPYEPGQDSAFSFRVIADHARATAFLIGDGVTPSNEGRSYVLRRIMRRAIYHGRLLGFTAPFFNQIVGTVAEQMREAYPDLVDKRSFMEKVTLAEEEQFLRTLERGLDLLIAETNRIQQQHGPVHDETQKFVLPGEIAFKLYDTYGLPLDLTRVICAKINFTVDDAGFELAMDQQRERARKHWKGSGDEAVSADYLKLAQDLKAKDQMPRFVGYDALQAEGDVLWVNPAPEGAIEAVFSVTPFYGESGGQVGDRGRVRTQHFEGEVLDVKKPVADLIIARVKPLRGTLKVGDRAQQDTDAQLRALTARNHTATHLLHWALRKVLGPHVKQAGSLVSPELLRFDFAHFQAVTAEELRRIEDLINEKIWGNDAVSKREMPKDAAIAAGALAMFGEKYADRVRVVSVGDYSTELCGGTHVDRSSDLHLFKIGNESGIAAGVRRIIAYTSRGAFEYLRGRDDEVKRIRDQLKVTSAEEIPGRIDKLNENEKALRKQLEQLQAKGAASLVDDLLAKARKVGAARLVAAELGSGANLRELADLLKQKAPDAVILLGMIDGPKVSLLAACGAQAQAARLSAADLLKEVVPLIEGRGGGKPEMAQAGGVRPAGLPEALARAGAWLKAKS